jgi:hypothetical protein
VAQSQVLLRNRGRVLPLSGHERIYVAGSNADDIGNQAGGWTVAWQGLSGDTIPGNTILEGIRQVAPGAQVTFSEDASAPTTGNDVGIVRAAVAGQRRAPRAQDDAPERPPAVPLRLGAGGWLTLALAKSGHRVLTGRQGDQGRGHALTIDSGWHEVADTALAFVKRFTGER